MTIQEKYPNLYKFLEVLDKRYSSEGSSSGLLFEELENMEKVYNLQQIDKQVASMSSEEMEILLGSDWSDKYFALVYADGAKFGDLAGLVDNLC